jgi:hypothetical protein
MANDSNKKKTVSPLLIVLMLILAVMVWRLVHDRWIVVKQHAAAWDRINKLQEEMNAKPGAAATGPQQVREAIGRKSTTGEATPVEHYFREDYVWSRGLPWMKYYICVIYRKWGDEPILHVACMNREPEEEELPGKPLELEELAEKDREASDNGETTEQQSGEGEETETETAPDSDPDDESDGS